MLLPACIGGEPGTIKKKKKCLDFFLIFFIFVLNVSKLFLKGFLEFLLEFFFNLFFILDLSFECFEFVFGNNFETKRFQRGCT